MGLFSRIWQDDSELQEQREEQSLTVSTSSLEIHEPPAVLKRLQNVVTLIQQFAMKGNDFKMKSLTLILNSVMEELVDELDGKSPEVLESYFQNIGLAVGWIGHGDSTRLPESMQQFVEIVAPEVRQIEAIETPAIESAVESESA